MHSVVTWNTVWLICKASAIKAELPEGARSIIFILLSYKCEFHTGASQPGAQHTTLAQRLGGLLFGDLQTHLDVVPGQGGSRWTQRSLPSSTSLGFWDSSLAFLPFLQCVRVTGFPGGGWPGASRSSLPMLFSHLTSNKLKPQISY